MAEEGTAKDVTPAEGDEVITDEQVEKAKKENPEKGAHLEAKQKKQNEGPPEGSKRWNEIYREAQEGKRKTAELEAKLKQVEEDSKKTFTELVAHNKKLMESIKDNVDVKRGETPDQILAKLRDEKKKARAEYDYDKAFEIQDQIDDLILAINKSKPDQIKSVAKEVAIEEEVRTAVNGFSNRNKWFLETINGKENTDYDYVKSGAATALERKLLPSWKGSYGDLLKEVEKQINEKFAATPSKVPAVAGDGESPPDKIKVELTDIQKSIARKMFPDDPDAEKNYLEQVKLLNRGKR